MKTRTYNGISFISYNSNDFLVKKLNEYIENEKISFYMFIEHEPEKTENKKHKHCYVEPITTIDKKKMKQDFNEIDIQNLDKPLSIVFDTKYDYSIFDYAYLYFIHEKKFIQEYTREKEKQFYYSFEDMQTNDKELLSELVSQIDYNKIYHKSKIIEALENEIMPYEALVQGIIELKEMSQYTNAYNEMQKSNQISQAKKEKLHEIEDMISTKQNLISELNELQELIEGMKKIAKNFGTTIQIPLTIQKKIQKYGKIEHNQSIMIENEDDLPF